MADAARYTRDEEDVRIDTQIAGLLTTIQPGAARLYEHLSEVAQVETLSIAEKKYPDTDEAGIRPGMRTRIATRAEIERQNRRADQENALSLTESRPVILPLQENDSEWTFAKAMRSLARLKNGDDKTLSPLDMERIAHPHFSNVNQPEQLHKFENKNELTALKTEIATFLTQHENDLKELSGLLQKRKERSGPEGWAHRIKTCSGHDCGHDNDFDVSVDF